MNSWMLVDTPQQLQAVVERYASRGTPVYADTETTGLNPRTGKLVAVQMWQGVNNPVIIDARRLDIQPLQGLQQLRWVFHNADFDWQWLATYGVELRSLYDSQIAEQVILSAKSGPSLKDVVEKYAAISLDKDGREWFYEPAPLNERAEWDEPFPTEQLQYMANDVLYLPAVCTAQANALRASGQQKVAMLEMRVIPAIARMEMNGVNVDVEAWRGVIREQEQAAERLQDELLESDLAQAILKLRSKELEAQVEARELWEYERDCTIRELREIWDRDHDKKEAGWGEFKKAGLAEWKARCQPPPTPNKSLQQINLRSPQQLKAGLEALGIRLKDTTKETLEKAVPRYPVLRPLLDLRACEKLVGTYGETLLAKIDVDGRMHPRFNQIGAETGRMSSSGPNWQNIPARTEVGKRLRQCVVAPPGKVLLVADFKNIELCILADQSGDERMMEMFASGQDLHTFTARMMFKIPDSISDAEIKESYRLPNGLKARDVAKTVNFGVAYGQTEWGFAKKFGTDLDTARGFIEQYFKLYERAGKYLKAKADEGLRNGYSTTPLGRRRYYTLPIAPEGGDPEFEEKWRQFDREQEAIRRASMNHPMQGGNADITKIAVADFDDLICGYGYDAMLVAVVHDELVVETPDIGSENIKVLLEDCMYRAAKSVLKRVEVPMPDVHPGKCWEH